MRDRSPGRWIVPVLLLALLPALLPVRLPAVGAPSVRAQELTELPTLALVPVDTLRLPSPGLRGLAFDGERAWLLMSSNLGLSVPDSNYRAAILRFDPATGAADTFATEPGAYEAGLALGPEFVWAGGNGVGGQESLYSIDPSTGEIVATLPAAGYHPGGLVWDEEYLWQVDADARQFARIETEEGKVSRRVATPGFYPTGLAYDGFHFWNADASTGRIYRVRAYNGRVDGVVDAEVFERPGTFMTLGFDGSLLWTAAADDSVVVRYEILD